MLDKKRKIKNLENGNILVLHSVLKIFSWCMCLTSVFILLTGIIFLVTGDQNIFFIRENFTVTVN